MANSTNIEAEYCPICKEVFRDPIMCSDGFCYCRECISEWVKGNKKWTSPLTNCAHYGTALLTQDLLRAGVSLQYHRDRIRSMPVLERFKNMPYNFFGINPLCTTEDCASIIGDKSIIKLVRREKPKWHSAFLDLCWRANALQKFPADCVIDFCRYERNSKSPFVQREIIRRLLHLSGERYKHLPNQNLKDALLECRYHYIWRLQQIDAVYVPDDRSPTLTSLVLVRHSYMPVSANYTHWISTTGACLFLPRLPAHKSCLQEPMYCEIAAATTGSTYKSQCEAALDKRILWRRRRGPPATCFPDSSGDTVSTSSTASTDEGSSTVTESYSSNSDEDENYDKLSIHEEGIWILPEGFEYVPRVKTEDEAHDTSGVLADIDNILVTHMNGKRKHDMASSCRSKRRQLM